MSKTTLKVQGEDYTLEIDLTDTQIKDLYRRAGYFGLGWSLGDIEGKAEEMGHELTREECADIASGLERRGDCENGITWLHLEYAIEEYIEDKDNEGDDYLNDKSRLYNK